jgi:5-(carboxyamino)imidazole ribonucleotide mutase
MATRIRPTSSGDTGDTAATSFIVAPVVPQVMAAATIRRTPIPRYTTARSAPVRKKRGDARPLVGVIMGSRSDWGTMSHTAATLEALGVPHEVRVVSAHRTPDLLFEYADSAARRGLGVIIAAAGGAAHLPGMTAAKTPLPVLGVPIESRALNGLDSLLSIVQMPAGVPVGTLAIGRAGAVNAALLAAAILGIKDFRFRDAVERFRVRQTRAVLESPDPRAVPPPAAAPRRP